MAGDTAIIPGRPGMKHITERNNHLKTPAAMLAAGLFAWFLNTACEWTSGIYTDAACICLLFVWALYAVWAMTSERKNEETGTRLLLGASFMAGLIFVLQSLKNFANNGRVSPAVAKIAGIMGICIIGKASDVGTLEPIHKCR